MNTKMTKLALALGALVMAGGAMAVDSGTGTMGVSASIINECAVGTAAELTFGDLAMLTAAGAQIATASASTGGGTFQAICTNGTPSPAFKFTSLNTADSKFRLVGDDASTFIIYTLATAANAAITYGTAAAFTGFIADGTAQTLTIKGSIAAADKAAKGVQAYSDTITITSSYTLP